MQKNKVKKAVACADLIQSCDSEEMGIRDSSMADFEHFFKSIGLSLLSRLKAVALSLIHISNASANSSLRSFVLEYLCG